MLRVCVRRARKTHIARKVVRYSARLGPHLHAPADDIALNCASPRAVSSPLSGTRLLPALAVSAFEIAGGERLGARAGGLSERQGDPAIVRGADHRAHWGSARASVAAEAGIQPLPTTEIDKLEAA